jgi:hypothetical protein
VTSSRVPGTPPGLPAPEKADLMDLDTRHRSRAGVLQFVRGKRGDYSFLIGTDLVRECAGIKMKEDDLLRLVES